MNFTIEIKPSPEMVAMVAQLSEAFGRLAGTVDTLAKRMADREEVFAQATTVAFALKEMEDAGEIVRIHTDGAGEQPKGETAQDVLRANGDGRLPPRAVDKPAAPSGSVDTGQKQQATAAAPAPAPKPPFPLPGSDRPVGKASTGRLRSPERDALIRLEYAAGVSARAVFEHFNKLPGLALTHSKRVSHRAAELGVRRPPGFDFTTAPDTLEEARRMYPPAAQDAPKASEPVAPPVAAPGAPKPPSALPAPEMTLPEPRPAGDWLTKERREEATRRIKAGEYPGLYCPVLRGMPGPVMPDDRKVAGRLRNAGIVWTPPPKAPTPRPNLGPDRLGPALALPREPIDTTTPIVTDEDTIRAKAAAWSLSYDQDLRDLLVQMNAKAKAIGHRPFQLEPVKKHGASA